MTRLLRNRWTFYFIAETAAYVVAWVLHVRSKSTPLPNTDTEIERERGERERRAEQSRVGIQNQKFTDTEVVRLRT